MFNQILYSYEKYKEYAYAFPSILDGKLLRG